MKVKIYSDRTCFVSANSNAGSIGENNVETLIFNFPERIRKLQKIHRNTSR